MIVTFWKGVFVADHRPEEAYLLRKAGFALHEPTLCESPAECRGCSAHIGRRYYSARVEHATRLKRFCNERALGVMKQHLDKLAKSRAVDSNIVVPLPPGLVLKPFQRAGVAFAVQRKDTLIADAMGLGKSIEALGFANYLHPKRVLIVCPATLVLNWKFEAEKWLVDRYRIFVPKTGSDIVPSTIPDERLLVITNYEKTIGVKRGDDRSHTPLSKSLVSAKWDIAIFDEAHYLKNPSSIRSQAILAEEGIYEHCRRTLFLTGTPMENRPIEIWPIAATLCPARFGDWWEFAKRYCALHEEERGARLIRVDGPDGMHRMEKKARKVWVADGSSNHSELQQRLRTSIMIRRLKEDVLKELPPKRRQLILLSDDDVDWSKFPDILRWREVNQSRFDEGMARLEAARTMAEYREAVKDLKKVTVEFTEVSDVRHKSALLKLPACLKFADEILTSVDSLVIFGHHRDVLEKIHEHYGEDSCVIYGDTPMAKRIPIVNQFQQGKKKIFIGGLKAAGVGITLTRASTTIFFEEDWNPATIAQAEDRLARIGQLKMVHSMHPVLDGTLDANMVKMTLTKQNVIDRMLDEMPEDVRQREVKKAAAYEDLP